MGYTWGMNIFEHPPWVHAFLSRLEQTGIVARACDEAGVSYGVAQRYRMKNEEFRAHWDEALEIAYDGMETEMQRRAFQGTSEPVFHQGQEVARISKYSDALAMFLMRGYRKRKFAQATELTGKDGEALAGDQQKRQARIEQLLALAKTRQNDAQRAIDDVSDLV